MPSILQPWVEALPLRAQGTLLTAVRSCDELPKLPLDSTARQLTAALRGAFLVPADSREVDSEPGCFMLSTPPTEWKASELGHLPLHFYAHVAHSAEVIAYYHPDDAVRMRWLEVYFMLVSGLHLRPELPSDLHARLTEDRIAAGTVVS